MLALLLLVIFSPLPICFVCGDSGHLSDTFFGPLMSEPEPQSLVMTRIILKLDPCAIHSEWSRLSDDNVVVAYEFREFPLHGDLCHITDACGRISPGNPPLFSTVMYHFRAVLSARSSLACDGPLVTLVCPSFLCLLLDYTKIHGLG